MCLQRGRKLVGQRRVVILVLERNHHILLRLVEAINQLLTDIRVMAREGIPEGNADLRGGRCHLRWGGLRGGDGGAGTSRRSRRRGLRTRSGKCERRCATETLQEIPSID